MNRHLPVLLPEVIDMLALSASNTVLDATIGSGGHSSSICAEIGQTGTLIGLDADKVALATAQETLEKNCEADVCLQKTNFRYLDQALKDCKVEEIDAALFDLGFRSEQLSAGRGFSFQTNEPLVMTYTHPDDLDASDLTAKTIVNEWQRSSLVNVLRGYGNESFAEEITDAVLEFRKAQAIDTTKDLVEIIEQAVPSWYQNARLHPATRTFQALRIAVNDEFGALSEALKQAFTALRSGGRLAVISFHSGEDRKVKENFSSWVDAKEAEFVTDGPLTPEQSEIKHNPRARSSKLRCLKKI